MDAAIAVADSRMYVLKGALGFPCKVVGGSMLPLSLAVSPNHAALSGERNDLKTRRRGVW